jgi:ABC-type glutathione transport system ATPase component
VTLLQVTGLRTEILTRTGPRTVVDGLDFAVAEGEVLAIVGESGSGKSVAMQSIMGLLPGPPGRVTAGTALFEGRDLLALPEAELRKLRGNRIGMIFQEPMSALNPMMPVGDQIAETIVTHRGLGWTAARAEAVRLLDQVRIPDAAARARLHPAALSGGMRQRVVIAAALACKPALVIADEPTTALDATVQAEILALLRQLRAEVGCAVVFITHDMAVVRQIADRVLVMQSGRAVETGTRDDILTRPQSPYTRTLIAASAPAAPRKVEIEATTAPPPLALENLVVSYPHDQRLTSFATPQRLYAVDGVSLEVKRGETVALVGESGSGKTTIARAILGLVRPDEGRVRLSGADVSTAPRPARGRVQFVFQDPQSALDPRYRAWQTVTEPLRIAGERNATQLRDRAATLLAHVGLDATYLDRLTHELSGGQRQRLGIARALSASPDLVIADEAVSALDATTKLQVLELFQSLQVAAKLPLLFITHDFAVVSRIAHRVAVLRFGRLVELGPTASVLQNPQTAYTRALIAAATGSRPVDPPRTGAHRIGGPGTQREWRPMHESSPGHFAEELA